MRAPLTYLCAGTILATAVCDLSAGPVGQQVINGTATFNQSGNTLTVTNSDKAIIHWQDFSIGSGEAVSFVQASSASSVLNRVVGSNPSTINGYLNSNGRVFLINQNGILVGPSGVINTQSFTASTLDFANNNNANFINGGDLTFAGSSTAGITNLGVITASSGDVILIAKDLTNSGSISASQGTVGLAAGSQVLVKASGGPNTERIFVQAGTGSINNNGAINSATTELKAAGGNAYALAINNTSVVNATSFNTQGGHIFITANQGDINTGRLNATGIVNATTTGNFTIGDAINANSGFIFNGSGQGSFNCTSTGSLAVMTGNIIITSTAILLNTPINGVAVDSILLNTPINGGVVVGYPPVQPPPPNGGVVVGYYPPGQPPSLSSGNPTEGDQTVTGRPDRSQINFNGLVVSLRDSIQLGKISIIDLPVLQIDRHDPIPSPVLPTTSLSRLRQIDPITFQYTSNLGSASQNNDVGRAIESIIQPSIPLNKTFYTQGNFAPPARVSFVPVPTGTSFFLGQSRFLAESSSFNTK